MKRMEILTEWIGDGLTPETAIRPRVIDEHNLKNYTDKTEQDSSELPPAVNVVVVEVVCSDEVAAAIEADPNTFVVWSEDVAAAIEADPNTLLVRSDDE